ncbi:MAG: transposase [Loktanella sp.]|nr:transposase [Loktanella sp.]
MPRYHRPQRPGATILFTVNLADRSAALLVREVAALRQAVTQTRAERPFTVNAWVVLPDHMHCIWTLPDGDSDYSTRMGAIKGRFSRIIRRSGFTPTPHPHNPHGVVAGRIRVGENPDRRAEAPIWQKRFWEHHIRDDRDFAAHMEYCRINPVKHGLVDDPADWPYTSFRNRGGAQ